MRFIALALFIALPLAATAGAPNYFRATAPLTVRDLPAEAGLEIGRIADGAAPLEVTAKSGGWGRIAWRGVDGWIPLAALAPHPAARMTAAALPIGLACAGTEPFWSLTFSRPGAAEFSAPDQANVSYEIGESVVAAGRPEFPALMALIGGDGVALAIVRPAACSDGMSDMTHGWTLDFLTERDGASALLTGCCRLPIPE